MSDPREFNAAEFEAEGRARLAYAEKFFAKLRKQAKPADDAAHDTKTKTKEPQQ